MSHDDHGAPLMAPLEPLVAPHEARVFASLVSRLVAGVDLAALPIAEVIFLVDLLERGTRALWRVHGADLVVHLPWPEGDEASEVDEAEVF